MYESQLSYEEWTWRYGTDMKMPFDEWQAQLAANRAKCEAEREARIKSLEFQAELKVAKTKREAQRAELEKQGKWRKPMSLAEALAKIESKFGKKK